MYNLQIQHPPFLFSNMRCVALSVLCLLCTCNLTAQDSIANSWKKPVDLPILLSGNFGELRSNHFHSGIDFKTQGRVGKAVKTVHDGYVSRISVSPSGYGNAIYVDHPNGLTTVYAHLLRFNDSIATYMNAEQYRLERFKVDIKPSKTQFPVKQGDLLGLSGNSGSSGGPHLHFEVRNTVTEEVLDPIVYYKDQIKDTRAPKIRSIKIYPIPGKGTLNGNTKPIIITPTQGKNGTLSISQPIKAWGEFGFAVQTYDYMDNTTNIYGVKEITLKADSTLLFRSDIKQYSFDETRYLNALIDYPEWCKNRAFFIKSFVEPGNKLRFIEAPNHGILAIRKAGTYQLAYQLSDIYGNKTTLRFDVTGSEQPIIPIERENTTLFSFRSMNLWGARGIRLAIPRNNLYSNLYFQYKAKADSTALALTHYLHNEPVPLNQSAQLSLHLQHDTLHNKQQYGIVQLKRGRTYWIGGDYRHGWIDADIDELGNYTINIDKVAPKITPINSNSWVSNQKITFKITDNLSGVKSYRATIDNQFVLFTHDAKTATITYHLNKQQLTGKHLLTLSVTDGCGNKATYTHTYSLSKTKASAPSKTKTKQKRKKHN